MVFPVWKQETEATFKTRWRRHFQTTQMWMGEGQENVTYNLPAPASPCPWSQHTWPIPVLGCTTWMHNSVDSVNVVPQHETCHGVGWKRESLVRAIQVPCKPLVNVVSTFCWLLYYAILCWRATGRINRHFTMVYHLWRPQSQCFENPLKTNFNWFTIRGLIFFPLTVSRYSSDHLPTTPRCNGSFGPSAEPQRPRCFF